MALLRTGNMTNPLGQQGGLLDQGGSNQQTNGFGQDVINILTEGLQNYNDAQRLYEAQKAATPQLMTLEQSLITPTPQFGSILQNLDELRAQEEQKNISGLLSQQEFFNPKYEKMKVDGSDVLIDINPNSPTFQQMISPKAGMPSLPSFDTSKTTPTVEEIQNVPLIEDSAQGDIFGSLARGGRGILGAVGINAAKETTRSEYFVENLNKDLRLNLVQDLGGRLTKVVSDELNKILPNPLQDNNVEFKVKAEELVNFSERRIAEINSKLPSMTQRERKEAINLIDGLSSRVRSYKAMLEKQKQFDAGIGVYAKKIPGSNEELMQEYNSISDRLGVLNR